MRWLGYQEYFHYDPIFTMCHAVALIAIQPRGQDQDVSTPGDVVMVPDIHLTAILHQHGVNSRPSARKNPIWSLFSTSEEKLAKRMRSPPSAICWKVTHILPILEKVGAWLQNPR